MNVASEALGVTPVMMAANFGDKESVIALVEKGANVNAQDKAGKLTVLHHAVYGANPDVITYLLQKGAKADVKDAEGQTALEMAVAANAPVKSDEEMQKEIEELAKKDPEAAAKLGMQRIVRSNADAPAHSKDLSKVIAALRQANAT